MDALTAAGVGFAPALASALLHGLWLDTLLGVAAALALAALGRASASRRHAVAMAFLVAMLLVPAAQFLWLLQEPAARARLAVFPVMMAPRLDATLGVFVQDPDPTAAVVVSQWLAGAAIMLARQAAGMRVLAAIERGAWEPLPPA